ncbi:MAG: hypothetical protein MRY79_09625, partial [Alphaproteobacteria bacterium]|nr:hypothetical protein [Alphaproteobacteria bacterium]
NDPDVRVTNEVSVSGQFLGPFFAIGAWLLLSGAWDKEAVPVEVISGGSNPCTVTEEFKEKVAGAAKEGQTVVVVKNDNGSCGLAYVPK